MGRGIWLHKFVFLPGDAADFLDLGVDFHKADVVGIFPGVAFQ